MRSAPPLTASRWRRPTRSRGGRPRPLRVNALATFALRWLIPRLSGFQVANPAVEVRLTTSNLPLAEEAGTFDIAVRGGPSVGPGLAAVPFPSERRIPVCSPALLRRLPLGAPAASAATRSCKRRRCPTPGRSG